MWRGRRDAEAQEEVDTPEAVCTTLPASKLPRKGWNSLRHRVPAWTRSAALVAVFIGFPVINLLFYTSLNLLPTSGGGEGGPSTVAHSVSGHHAGNARGEGLSSGGVLSHGRSGTNGDASYVWTDLASKVASDDLSHRYERYFNSDSRVLQGYGRVLIVSDTFLGPVDALGPATSMTTLAELLSGNGFDVTMLYTRGKAVQKGTWELWENYWSGRGLHLVGLPDSPVSYDVAKENEMSHRVYLWLMQAEPFDVVHFSDVDGVGYWTLKAKYQGLAFQRMTTVVHMLAPHLWRKVGGLESLDNVRDLMVDFMQRESVRQADLVVAPSQFILNWAVDNGWEGLQDSQRVFHSSNVLPAWVLRRARAVVDEMPFSEVVFFSRLELRKGLVLFCDVLDRIERRSPDLLKGIRVTFLGTPAINQTLPLPDNLHAPTDEYIRFRGVKWRSFSWSIVTNMDSQDRIDYMMAGSRLAMFPMIAENSPYAIQECIVCAA